ncbi:MAG: hypothetical protein AVDCRST_MAG67-2839, partial [uncultured Solirubrobacteraceae bacterium]
RALAVVLAGAAAALALPALAGAVALERLVLGPAVARLAADYATLPLAVAAGDVLLVGGALALMCALAVLGVTRSATREPVAAGLERAD